MKLVIITMRDSKVGIYLQPMTALSAPSAVRDLQEGVNAPNKELPWQKFPQDFDIYKCGEFDSDTGKLLPQEPEFLLNLGTLKGV